MTDLEKILSSMGSKFVQVQEFYDQMDLSPDQGLAMTKVITELIDPLGSSGLAKNRPRRNIRFEGL